jgi:hypothetical protein
MAAAHAKVRRAQANSKVHFGKNGDCKRRCPAFAAAGESRSYFRAGDRYYSRQGYKSMPTSWNRRQFIIASAASLAGQFVSLKESGSAQADPFVCMTLQFSKFDKIRPDELQLRPSSSTGGKVELSLGSASANVLQLQKYQLLLREDAWRQEDSLPGTPSNKIRLAVNFLDGTAWQRQAVQQYAGEWLTNGGAEKVEFVFGSDDPRHIRVSFNTTLNDCAVGRQAKLYPSTGPTMHLGDVRPDVDRNRAAAVIRHEFGHALGMRHEHQHPLGGIQWNKPVVIAYYVQHGWTPENVQQFVFDIFTDASYMCPAAGNFNPRSIMMYPIAPGWAQNILVPYNINIIQEDFVCVHSVYT